MIKIQMYQITKDVEKVKQCCPSCAKLHIIKTNCPICGGKGVRNVSREYYRPVLSPVTIEKIDRDPKTGKLRYWISSNEYAYEETYPSDNPYVPPIKNGVHLFHLTQKDAIAECDRINKFLRESE